MYAGLDLSQGAMVGSSAKQWGQAYQKNSSTSTCPAGTLVGCAGTMRVKFVPSCHCVPLSVAAAAVEVAAATVEATAASSLFCKPVSPGVSSTVSEPSSFKRVIVSGLPVSAAVFAGVSRAAGCA